jgi:hypothetical protein
LGLTSFGGGGEGVSPSQYLRGQKLIVLLSSWRSAEESVYTMEEPGELCIVVFALIVTEPATECMCEGGGDYILIPRFRNNLCKDDNSPDSSMLYTTVYSIHYTRSLKLANIEQYKQSVLYIRFSKQNLV